ncbi:MAG: hypothetical protein IKG09_00770 [Mycoplasmataceae bacterium]|nr:hypothetical protein [Mycoplasmataceae bacterium]MBR4025752.1 hypothetical protein [Mycoplasmataceae bacterium]
MSKFSKKEIKQKIDNNYQEIISCNEETFQEDNQKILQLTIKGTMKKEQNQNEYKPKNQFEALIINQFTNMNNRLDNIETRLDRVETRLDNIETRLENVETRLENVETRLENVETRLDRVETRLENVETRLENVEADINQIKNTPTMKKELN